MLQDDVEGIEWGEEEGERLLRTSWSVATLAFGGSPLLDDIVRDEVIFM